MKKIFCLPLLAFFAMCSSPKIQFTDYKGSTTEYSESLFLKNLEAEDSIFSALIFTEVFQNENITIKQDGKIIFEDYVKSDESLGLAKAIKIKNQSDLEITDSNMRYSFKLSASNNRKYKFIYITKEIYKKEKYIITYSNSLKGFY